MEVGKVNSGVQPPLPPRSVDSSPALQVYEIDLQTFPSLNRVKWTCVALNENQAFKMATERIRKNGERMRVANIVFVRELPERRSYEISFDGLLMKWWKDNRGRISNFVLIVGFTVIGSFSTFAYILKWILRGVFGLLSLISEAFLGTLRLVLIRNRPRERKKVVTVAPGSRLLSIADFLCSPISLELTFRPIVRDLRSEYLAALALKRRWKAKWIRVRYLYSFIAAMGLNKLFSLLKEFRSVGR